MSDPITLAHAFLEGRPLKRGAVADIVRDLLALLESRRGHPPVSDHAPAPIPPPGTFQAVWGADRPSPIKVERGICGAVFLGPESNRYYTRVEAVALAKAITRAAAI